MKHKKDIATAAKHAAVATMPVHCNDFIIARNLLTDTLKENMPFGVHVEGLDWESSWNVELRATCAGLTLKRFYHFEATVDSVQEVLDKANAMVDALLEACRVIASKNV